LFQEEADRAVHELIKLLRSIGSAANVWVVMAAAEAIIPSQGI